MTATIRRPDPNQARQRRPRRARVRFSFMESLGFIESPTTVSRTWAPPYPVPSQGTPLAPVKRGAHERTVADLDPIDTTSELLSRNVRWGVVATSTVVLLGLGVLAGWLWQRPSSLAEAAVSELTTSAADLAPKLESLQEATATLGASQIDTSAINLATLSVDAAARELFNASAALPASQSGPRTQAADIASRALDASRILSDATAYRAAAVQILAAPAFETNPELIALDEAVRQIGSWRLNFDQIRSALPEGTMSSISNQLHVISGNLESIQNRYIDGLREDDQRAAESALLELAVQLEVAETLLTRSLGETQESVAGLIEESLTGIDRLLG